MAPESTPNDSDATSANAASTGEADAAGLFRSLQTLHDRLRGFESDPEDAPDASRAELVRFEQELRSLVEAYGAHDATARQGELTACLGDIQHWRRLCRQFGLKDAAASTEALYQRLLDRTREGWDQATRELAEAGDAEACFQSLVQTTTLEVRTHGQATAASGTDPFVPIKDRLRDAFERAVAADDADAETRQRWARRLIDQAEMVLTAVDETLPGAASAQLSIVESDLTWHIDHVETTRTKAQKQLRRKLRQVRAEHQERQLQHRLESRFGRRFVARSERFVVFLICGVVAILAAQWARDWPPVVDRWFLIADTVACAFFLTELAVKFCHVTGRLRWLGRHALVDFIPSIPVGLLITLVGPAAAGGSPADAVRAGRTARFLRLPRLMRYIRVLRPAVRLLRGFGLLSRGIDRLVRRHGDLLNRNVVLVPTQEERARSAGRYSDFRSTANQVRIALRDHWEALLVACPEEAWERVASDRLAVLDDAAAAARLPVAQQGTMSTAAEEITADDLLQRLRSMSPREIEAALGQDLVEQLGRFVRVFAQPPLRWFPILHAAAPRISEDASDAEAVAAASRKGATSFKRIHDLWFWVSDLYGTVTPSQFVDRVGTMLVNSSFRPAYRLVLFGAGVGLTWLALRWFRESPVLVWLYGVFNDVIGPTMLVLGGACLIVLGIGWWLKSLAQEATDFYERSAEAQFLSLTEVIRGRYLGRDARILYDRVLRAEWPDDQPPAETASRAERLGERMRQSLLGLGRAATAPFDTMERVVLLYRDWLDGAMFTESDTRTTSQLLGNPAIGQALEWSHRIDKAEKKALERIDLTRQKALLGGPYLWFNFISRAIAHSVASLLVDYNRNAVPLSEMGRLPQEEEEQYERWLRSAETPAEQVQQGREGILRALMRRVSRKKQGDANKAKRQEEEATRYRTTAFTAMHFIDDESHRDEKLRRRFGDAVLERVRADRQLLIRRIFGTFPWHRRPRSERVVNLYTFYQSWLARGRALFLPLFVLGALFGLIGYGLRWLRGAVKEIRRPELRGSRRDAAQAYFATAVRKIHRIRGPAVVAALRLRMRMDPEFLGVPLPGERGDGSGGDVDDDRGFLQPELELDEEIGQEKRRARDDMRRLKKLIDGGLFERVADRVGLSPDQVRRRQDVRAVAVAYLADHRGVRSHLSTREILKSVYQAAAQQSLRPRGYRPRPVLRRTFNRYWAAHGFGGRDQKRAAWRATVHNVQGVADALAVWKERGEDARSEGEDRLGEILRQSERVTEQLLTLRVVQTLSILDVLDYRDHVYRLGQYEEDVASLLDWAAVSFEATATAEATAARGEMTGGNAR